MQTQGQKPRRAVDRRFLAALLVVAIVVLGSFAGQGPARNFLVTAAHAQSAGDSFLAEGHDASTAPRAAHARDLTLGEALEQDIRAIWKAIVLKFEALIQWWRRGDTPEGIVKTNGRIEATEIDVASKYAGRLESVLVDEGDDVKAGQVVAVITSPEYEAQLRSAQANVLHAKSTLAYAEATLAERKADQVYYRKDLERGRTLVKQGWLTHQVFDQRVSKAGVADAALLAAEKQCDVARAAVKSAEAEGERISAIIKDLTLRAPRDGRVQYRMHRSGEVVNAGTRIIQILDLKDVYMTIYLPSAQAGNLGLGDPARLILDPYPGLVIPAYVSFVATEAQFTPKPVETATEREKLIFRIKLQIDPKVLKKYYRQVKTGVRGVGFVRTDPAASWPENLAVKLPDGG